MGAQTHLAFIFAKQKRKSELNELWKLNLIQSVQSLHISEQLLSGRSVGGEMKATHFGSQFNLQCSSWICSCSTNVIDDGNMMTDSPRRRSRPRSLAGRQSVSH